MISNEPGAYVIEVTAEKCHHLAVDIALDLVVVDLEAVREVVDAVDVTAVAVVVVMMWVSRLSFYTNDNAYF